MSKRNYEWKRFFCPRSGSINLGDGGYLHDPDQEWGKAHNSSLVSLEEIAEIPCLVLLGEPGIGKSQELENLQIFTEKKISDPCQILEVNLRSCTNLKEDLFKDENFTDWLKSSYDLYLFLDSLDEGLLNVENLALVLIDELKKRKYKDHLNRLYFRLTCRTFIFPKILEEGLKELWQEANFWVYELAPLRRKDIIDAAKTKGFCADDFLKEIYEKNLVPLAIKPITLNFLLNIYHRNQGQFSPEQKLHQLYLEGCRELCVEPKDADRHPSNPVSSICPEERLIVAARIAAITIFSNRFAVWFGKKVDIPNGDLFISIFCCGHEKIKENSFKITNKVIKEVLGTGLFSSRGLDRMGWAHQTYAEFLAAWYLKEHKMPLAQIKELIFSSEDSDHKLIPQLHETAAWLASMRKDIFHEIIKTDPNVLLQSDVPTDPEVKALIVESLLTQYEEEKIFNEVSNNYRDYTKLNHPGLVEQLRPYICDSSKQSQARELAINMAGICKISEFQDDFAKLALDSSEFIDVRLSAVQAIYSVGDSSTKLKLKPLAIEKLPEDTNDQLKDYVIQLLWPDYLAVEELFESLGSFHGAYSLFINYKLVPQLDPDHLVVALDWLKKQERQRFGDRLDTLEDEILFKAWENFNLPGVAEGFTEIALVQWKKRLTTYKSELKEKFASSLLRDTEKRHKLIEKIISVISKTGENPSFLSISFMQNISFTQNILVTKDIFWMLDHIKKTDCEKVQRSWSTLIKIILTKMEVQSKAIDAKKATAILEVSQINPILRDELSCWVKTVDLNSAKAVRVYKTYLMHKMYDQMHKIYDQQHNSLVELPPPKEKMLQYLNELELGNLDAWWQLNMEMTVKPNSNYYGDELEFDLTQLPGWQEADENTRRRIVEGAKKYIHQEDRIDHSLMHPRAGCRALLLLLKQRPGFFKQLSFEIWQRWTPNIINAASRMNHNGNSCFSLIFKYAYQHSPNQFIKTLMLVIDQENQNKESNYLFVIEHIEHMDQPWDENLQLALFKKAKKPSLKPECTGQLLELLLKQGLTEAEDFAKSLISLQPLLDENDCKKRLIVATILLENSNSSSWSFIWKLIQQDLSFGRKVLESVAYRSGLFGIELNLTEMQLTNLYIWLVNEYPYKEDPDYPNNGQARDFTPRDGIKSLKNSVLWQLKEQGTLEACTQIQRLIQELPDLPCLGKTLIDAQANMRRKTWKPLKPEEFFQFVISQDPSNLDVINRITKKMEEDPKIRNEINISNSPNSPINAPIGTNGVANSNVTVSSPAAKQGFNWGNWLAVIGILATLIGTLVTMNISGAFNEEFKEWLNNVFSSNVEQHPESESELANP